MITWNLDDEVLKLKVRKDLYFLRKEPDRMILLFGIEEEDMFEVTGPGAELCGYLQSNMSVQDALNKYIEVNPDKTELAGEMEDFILMLGELEVFAQTP